MLRATLEAHFLDQNGRRQVSASLPINGLNPLDTGYDMIDGSHNDSDGYGGFPLGLNQSASGISDVFNDVVAHG